MPAHPLTPPPAHPLISPFALQPTANLISFTGGGGKTSLLFTLAHELVAAGRHIVATTTTRMATVEIHNAPSHCLLAEIHSLREKLYQYSFCLVMGEVDGDKVQGVPLSLPAQLLARADVDDVLVEADGARMLPIKAPAPHEPAIPPETTLVVPVVGIDALSAPLETVAHRPELLAALLDLSLHEKLNPGDVARLLTSNEGGLRNVPPQARVIPFINKVESDEQLVQAEEIAHLTVAHPRIERVLIGALQTEQPVRRTVES